MCLLSPEVRSERRLVEQLRYNLLLHWFVGLPLDRPVFHATSFTKNRERLLTSAVPEAFFCAIRDQAEEHKLLSREHFSVDGTLLEAAASLKSLRPHADSEGEEPPAPAAAAATPRSTGAASAAATRRTARPSTLKSASRKGSGKEARLCYAGNTLTENRNGLIVECELTRASGTAEREAGLRLVARRRGVRRRRLTVGADRGYDAKDFVAGLRAQGATPHVARKMRFSALDARTTRHSGYAISQRRRKLVEEPCGWMKTVGGLGKLRHRGKAKASAVFTLELVCTRPRHDAKRDRDRAGAACW